MDEEEKPAVGGWESLGGELASAPAVTSWAANEMQVFCIFPDGALWNRYWDGEAWHPWETLGGERLWEAPWPVADPAMLVSDEVTYAVQVNGRLRGELTVAADLGKPDVLAAARAVPNVARHLGGASVVKEIFVPGKLVNLVTG